MAEPGWEPHSDEPSIPRWPRRARLVFLIVAALAAWGLVVAGAMFLWRARS